MKLIADAGASTTDWRLIKEDDSVEQYKTIGFNPYYQDISVLEEELNAKVIPYMDTAVQEVYYYGTGCGSESNRKIIANSFQSLFAGASIEVQHDMLAAARALCGTTEGIACILGTGANSCFYNGTEIVDNVASLGYVLGDEGSGTYLGRQLVADNLRRNVPTVIEQRFTKRFGLNKDEILDRVYNGESPGRFLASFAKFIFQNIKEPYCHRLAHESFKTFFEKNVMKYDNYENVPIHFTGSVAFYFSNILRQVANDLGLRIGHVIESPIAGLTIFHQQTSTD